MEESGGAALASMRRWVRTLRDTGVERDPELADGAEAPEEAIRALLVGWEASAPGRRAESPRPDHRAPARRRARDGDADRAGVGDERDPARARRRPDPGDARRGSARRRRRPHRRQPARRHRPGGRRPRARIPGPRPRRHARARRDPRRKPRRGPRRGHLDRARRAPRDAGA
ncbi:hypothetical protein [Clavibacter tessellarius]|uniref:hypothetical protein n=1 Tax=Clavibacter tessellarius TaxID=31965 RepID=UPI0039BEE367